MSDTSLPSQNSAAFSGARFARALNPTWLFWFSMLAASALGTNLGDLVAEVVGLGRVGSLLALSVISALAIFVDARLGERAEAGYWVAIVALRAAATNVGDILTHDAGLSYLSASVLLALATLAAGYFSRINRAANSSPDIDARYWGAMLIAGVFGTVCGDMIAHSIGLLLATVILVPLTVVAIIGRRQFAATSVLAYWVIVLAERCAGTVVGDGIDSRHGLALGLPIATIITCALLAIGLAMRQRILSGTTGTHR